MRPTAELRDRIKKLEAEPGEEDFPGQRIEIRREMIVKMAVGIADDLIMEGSEGSEEETNYLTSAVAKAFAEKVHMANGGQLRRYDLEQRSKPQDQT